MEPQRVSDPGAEPGLSPSLRRRRCAMRLVRDAQQQMILVYELVASPGDTEPSVLVFELGASNVRIDKYPAAWRTLPDADLLAIGVS